LDIRTCNASQASPIEKIESPCYELFNHAVGGVLSSAREQRWRPWAHTAGKLE